MYLALIFVGIFVSPVVSFLAFQSYLWVQIIGSILIVVVSAYSFLSIFSLHEKFRISGSYETLA